MIVASPLASVVDGMRSYEAAVADQADRLRQIAEEARDRCAARLKDAARQAREVCLEIARAARRELEGLASDFRAEAESIRADVLGSLPVEIELPPHPFEAAGASCDEGEPFADYGPGPALTAESQAEHERNRAEADWADAREIALREETALADRAAAGALNEAANAHAAAPSLPSLNGDPVPSEAPPWDVPHDGRPTGPLFGPNGHAAPPPEAPPAVPAQRKPKRGKRR